MEINYEFNLEDWVVFQRHHLNNSKKYKRRIMYFSLMTPLVFLVFIVKDVIQDEFDWIFASIAIVVSVGFIFIFPKRALKRTVEILQKRILETDASNVFGKHQFSWNDDGFTVIQPISEVKVEWGSCNRLEESQEHYFIYHTELSAFVVPKGKATGDVVAFEQIIRERIKMPDDH